jgi:mono/diheme cytochrome c family protein
LLRKLEILAIALSGAFLAAVVGLLLVERTWVTREPQSPRDYFLYGSTGTELMPLPLFQVLPGLFPEHFQPAGKAAGDWVAQFGFVRGRPGVNDGLPLGLSLSQHRPKSGATSPVPFVGFNCAVCHTGRILRSPTDSGILVYGMGSSAIDLVAFGDAIKSSLLDEKRLTPHIVDSAYRATQGRGLGLSQRLMITLYLRQIRPALRAEFPLRDMPFGGADLRDPSIMTSGPGRNQPMKETVRFLLHRTPTPDGGSSKIPSLYHQDRREWAQYDGSVRDPSTRNSLAALGVGASIQNLRLPLMLHTLRQTTEYVRTLEAPRYADVFRDDPRAGIDPARAARGKDAYHRYCATCHGSPGEQPGSWMAGPRQGEVIRVSEVGTDDARTVFRYYNDMARFIYDFFPPGHPLKPKADDVRASRGYINAPIEAAFSRAPYLHNGSVATLAELINLKLRRPVLYRGSNLYDPVAVGLLSPDTADTRAYFRYDTRLPGNSNRGHDYPWAYRASGWNENVLLDLLEYLKTL